MATKERLISADLLVQDINADPYRTESEKSYDRCLVHRQPTVDAIPVDEFKLHHIIIDNEGVPEVKLQIGDRYFLLRTDPVDVREVVHGRWERSRKHIWKMDDGEIDMFAYESGFHNGPVCLCCGAHFCVNCELDWAETECYDDEHFECSVCGIQSMEGTNYCPNCGAKMDGDGNGT